MAEVAKAAPGSEVERFVEMNAAIEKATDKRESLGPRELATLLNIHGDVELHHAHIERPQSVPAHVLSTIVTLPIKCTCAAGLGWRCTRDARGLVAFSVRLHVKETPFH